MSKKNINCLEGLQCPSCGHEDEIHVIARRWVSVTDFGSDAEADSLDDHDTEYDDNSTALCPKCRYLGQLGHWRMKHS